MCLYPISQYFTTKKFSLGYKEFLAAIQTNTKPCRFFDAMVSSHWQEAMKNEIDGLERNQIRHLTTLSHGKKALGCK